MNAGIERRDVRPLGLLRTVVPLVGQGVVYGFQFATALALAAQPDSLSELDRQAILLVILFVLGINRAWKYVGADTPGLLQTLVSGLRRR